MGEKIHSNKIGSLGLAGNARESKQCVMISDIGVEERL